GAARRKYVRRRAREPQCEVDGHRNGADRPPNAVGAEVVPGHGFPSLACAPVAGRIGVAVDAKRVTADATAAVPFRPIARSREFTLAPESPVRDRSMVVFEQRPTDP